MMRCLWLFLAALLAGCNATSSMTVRAPGYSGTKAPLSVAFSPAGGPDGLKLVNRHRDPDGWATVRDDGSIDEALRAILESQFERVLPPGVAGADFQAQASLENPVQVMNLQADKSPVLHLTLTHVPSGDVVFKAESTVIRPYLIKAGPIGVLAMIPPMYFLIPIAAKRGANLQAAYLKAEFDKELDLIARRLSAAMPAIREYPARMAKAKAAAAVADAAAGAAGAIAGTADAAATAGRHQDAFDKYLEAMRALPAGHKRIAEFLAKLLPLVPKVDPPELPEEARKEFYAGVGKSQTAKTQWDGAAAAKMLEKAVELAPWWPEAHYNLAVAYEIAQEYKKAAAAFGNFLVVKPDAKEAEETRKRMYALEGRGR